MNILFFTIGRFESIEAHSIYADLMRCFRNHKHNIYVISPYEKRIGKKTELIEEENAQILHVRTGNVTGTSNLVSKGIAQVSLEKIFIKAVKKYFYDVKFDLVIYSTPPIMFCKAVEYVKKRDGAKTYLLLKDIFPQNAVDLGMIKKNGIKSIIYKYFRNKEKKLYKISDYIGCMSQANVEYIINHNSEIKFEKLEICPNSIEVVDKSVDYEKRNIIREKYGISKEKIIFIYGGNLGKPQGIPFIIECLKECKDIENICFLIVGDGTERYLIENYISEEKPKNVKLLEKLPKEDYENMVGACDVGLIFLDHRFTIPNFPSRLLAYMSAKIPIFAVTDSNTDVGDVICNGKFGWWCESDDRLHFKEVIETIGDELQKEYGENGYKFLINNYSIDNAYNIICSHFE